MDQIDQIPAKLRPLPENFVPFSREQGMRNLRNTMLASVDMVNPVWYNNLTQQQQTELAAYRQALLDVPQQSTFPDIVVWPEKPQWLP